MAHFVGITEDQDIRASGTDIDTVQLEDGVAFVLPATQALFQAVSQGDVSWLTIDIDGVETACLEEEREA
ncbi:hypothetical protein FHS00_001306 [Limimaricola variabilis]|uniref:FkbM family methyltransferase n=1 Tax=Limimaricola variabilis TaxID=1492771 RepID=A0ABR6HMG1_9RHOB|nr:hypothetical protein [Limimaricola variabilis]MBB3711735.1 hypothetical protein [Limimaricola variabilis]